MATVQQIIALVRSYARGDDERFMDLADKAADEAVRRGQAKAASELKALLVEARGRQGVIQKSRDPIPLHRPRGDLIGIMSLAMPDTRLSRMVLSEVLLNRLTKVVKEQRQRGKLIERSLEPRRKFLLTGPPGTGKTMSAAAIAGELGLPLFTVLLDGLITKFMGETAAKLRLVFEAMTERRGVYFFDEVDALATSRGADNDVGEARRILNSFLQFLDEDKSTSLIFAATNHPELLDKAFFRRFQATIEYALPEDELVRPIIENAIYAFDLVEIDWELVLEHSRGLSHADLVAASNDAARDAVLDHDGKINTQILIGSLKENRRHPR
ncbi:ATPase [Methylosinus sp. C49]|uniref:AAA family ATPase n=1 Tax=unclassified Methylosinus TaxID=2624500 RepID=UPI00136782FE|nr:MULTISPECIES: ATP-binding protein [unclassified Methylosinus]BBU60397.1 ATPase [Methylosinus sp. C49]